MIENAKSPFLSRYVGGREAREEDGMMDGQIDEQIDTGELDRQIQIGRYINLQIYKLTYSDRQIDKYIDR